MYMNIDELCDGSSQTSDDDDGDEEMLKAVVEDIYDLEVDLNPRYAFNAAILKTDNRQSGWTKFPDSLLWQSLLVVLLFFDGIDALP